MIFPPKNLFKDNLEDLLLSVGVLTHILGSSFLMR